MGRKKVTRLIEGFRPDHYNLSIAPDRQEMSFKGTVTITGLKQGRPSKRITFHQNGLKITGAKVEKLDKKENTAYPVSRISHHKTFNEVRLHSSDTLYPGKYSIRLEFTGRITTSMAGIYTCNFNHRGVKKKIIATQFESHYAREAFPCIDEPEAKATFDLTVVAGKNDIVLSNMPARKRSIADTKSTTNFETTPRMSTYLLAFVAGELHYVQKETKDGIIVKSWAAVSRPKSMLEYSAGEAVEAIEFFSDYFKTPYPLSKYDQVGLPDFDAGAMENWGLVTFRESVYLTDPENRSVSTEQTVSMVVAHEVSHQWFGNLVTMKWWDDLWLNESFAALMEHFSLSRIHPDWNQWETYTADDVLTSTSRDVYSSIQPVGVEVTDPDILNTLFDPGIVYTKGGRLLKMLKELIGDEAFSSGLKNYFNAHAYSNATREDLWKALSKSSGKNVSELMTPWLEHPGMPLLDVVQNGKTLTISQSRFTLDGGNDPFIWPVPLLADHKLSPDTLTEKTQQFQADTDAHILVNQRASGHFLTSYKEKKHRTALAKKVSEQNVPTEARINLLNDMYMLARSGKAPLTDGLNLVISSISEPRDNVWTTLLRLVGSAQHLTEGNKTAEVQLKSLRQVLAEIWYAKLGWEDADKDDPNTKQLRRTMVSLMVGGENPAAVKKAMELYRSHKNVNSLPAELRPTILAAVIKHGTNNKDIDHLLKIYPDEVPDIQHDIASAVAATKSEPQAKHILSKALGPEGSVRPQDVMRWLVLLLRNHHTRSATWKYIVDEWQWIEQTLSDSKSFDFLPVYMAGVISTPDGSKKFHKLFDDKKTDKTLQKNIAIGSADIEARIAWRKRDEKKIMTWLASKVQPREIYSS